MKNYYLFEFIDNGYVYCDHTFTDDSFSDGMAIASEHILSGKFEKVRVTEVTSQKEYLKDDVESLEGK